MPKFATATVRKQMVIYVGCLLVEMAAFQRRWMDTHVGVDFKLISKPDKCAA